jgi:hypothetical protein
MPQLWSQTEVRLNYGLMIKVDVANEVNVLRECRSGAGKDHTKLRTVIAWSSLRQLGRVV